MENYLYCDHYIYFLEARASHLDFFSSSDLIWFHMCVFRALIVIIIWILIWLIIMPDNHWLKPYYEFRRPVKLFIRLIWKILIWFNKLFPTQSFCFVWFILLGDTFDIFFVLYSTFRMTAFTCKCLCPWVKFIFKGKVIFWTLCTFQSNLDILNFYPPG